MMDKVRRKVPNPFKQSNDFQDVYSLYKSIEKKSPKWVKLKKEELSKILVKTNEIQIKRLLFEGEPLDIIVGTIFIEEKKGSYRRIDWKRTKETKTLCKYNLINTYGKYYKIKFVNNRTRNAYKWKYRPYKVLKNMLKEAIQNKTFVHSGLTTQALKYLK